MMMLCFGTFARIICSCSKDIFTQKHVVGTMTQTIDESCKYIENDSAVTRLLLCKNNLSDGRRRLIGLDEGPLSLVKEKAVKVSRDEVSRNGVNKKFMDSVWPLIDNAKRNKLVLALCDLICDDATLDAENGVNGQSFKKHVGVSKDYFDMLRKNEDTQLFNKMLSTSIHEILAGILLYTVIEVKNTVGRGYVNKVDEYIKERTEEEILSQAKTETKKFIIIENLPFSRNKYFTGRDELLNQIYDKFAVANTDGHTTQVIYGFGGMGKSSLASEYAHMSMMHNKNTYEAICWITCTDEEAIKNSCISFLGKTGMTAVLDAVSSLNHWLQTNNNWLLILDDVEDDRTVERLMPKMGKGHILVTARRDKDFITRDTTIKLECVHEDEAVDFLIKRASRDDKSNAKLLANRLGYLPLALEQAAAFICKIGIDFDKFIEFYEERKLKLFEGRHNKDTQEMTILTVCEVTLSKLSDESKRVLYCFSYMPHNINLLNISCKDNANK